MKLIINNAAACLTSRGGRRYFNGVFDKLDWTDDVILTNYKGGKWRQRLSESLELGNETSIFWSPSHRGPLFVKNHVMTVFDCISLEHTYKNDIRLPIYKKYFQKILDNSKYIVPISNSTAQSLRRNFDIDERKLCVIAGPAGLSDTPYINKQLTSGLGDISFIQKQINPSILMVTNSLPHKNTKKALMALARSKVARDGVTIRVAGNLQPEAYLICQEANLRIVVDENIPDDKLVNWYKEAIFLFSPSISEGLNLTIAEAIALGCNILCSDIEAHTEFYSGYAKFFDPNDLIDMIDNVNEALTNKNFFNLQKPDRALSTFAHVAKSYNELFKKLSLEI